MSSNQLLARPSESQSSAVVDSEWIEVYAVEDAVHPVSNRPRFSSSPGSALVDKALSEGVTEEALGEFVARLGNLFPFSPEVRYGQDGSVHIWLKEFGIYGSGENFDAAAWCLVGEVLDYVEDWEKELSDAPGHAQRKGWVWAVLHNRSPERLYKLLFE